MATVVRPPVCTLPCLSVLCMNAGLSGSANETQHPLQAAFHNLRLPALHTLSLGSMALTWHGSSAITEIHDVLVCAPGIRKLSLGLHFLGSIAIRRCFGGIPALRRDVEPLATHAPRLEQLRFYVLSPVQNYGASVFCNRIFRSSHWLDLKSSTSTVREVTLVLSCRLRPTNMWVESGHRSLLVSEIRRYVHAGVTVRLQEDGPVEVRRAVWGW